MIVTILLYTLHPALIEWECVRHEGVRFVLLQQPQKGCRMVKLRLKVCDCVYVSVCMCVFVCLKESADTFVCLKHSINIYELQYFPIPIYTI